MRVGIILFSHESNTFVTRRTTVDDFQKDALLVGQDICTRFLGTHHELGGFLDVLSAEGTVEIVPVFAARALPAGMLAAEAYEELLAQLIGRLHEALPLDGLLVAPHGAMVSESHADADGEWLRQVRAVLGEGTPIIGTLDLHANLSENMVDNCDALIAYRSNPHLDQRERGKEAAKLLVQTFRGQVRPTMRAALPPVAINIERQLTSEAHMQSLYGFADSQLENEGIVSNSVLLGFPYADVAEMGSAVICVADDDPKLALSGARQLGETLWNRRSDYDVDLVDVEAALDRCERTDGTICLLDMGDNVGGGSAGDGTFLAAAIHRRRLSNAFVCIFDPEAVIVAQRAGQGETVELDIGGKSDKKHGPTLKLVCEVVSFASGKFSETKVRHGGMDSFDQGATAIVRTGAGMTLMLTSSRMVPFSLQQLLACGVTPSDYRILVAKGVHAPVAAYAEVCQHMIRVNTGGSTCADMRSLLFQHRRKPMFPFEMDTSWSSDSSSGPKR